ncbi:MAG: cupin domain-containing protein [Bacteroidetes bacterium]|nr:cupin domain-containing protein [Bacteroidota bacterium]
MKRTPEFWKEKLSLNDHPEGGYFKEVYRSVDIVNREHLPAGFNGDRNFSTSIYYLLSGNDTSKFHRIKSDELWHFYDGSTLLIYEIESSGNLKIHRLGTDIEKGDLPQTVIRASNWFGAKPENTDTFCLAGCTVSPGFHFEDFEMADRNYLLKNYPEHSGIINILTEVQ